MNDIEWSQETAGFGRSEVLDSCASTVTQWSRALFWLEVRGIGALLMDIDWRATTWSPGIGDVRPARSIRTLSGGKWRRHHAVVSRNNDEMQKHAGRFDFILDAAAADHDINAYIDLLRRDGNITMVGAPNKPLAVSVFGLIFKRRSFSGSPIGGIPET
jgi:hypothetical protein